MEQEDFLKEIVCGKVIPEIEVPIAQVMRWMEDKAFLEKYETAKKLRSEIFHDEAVKIAQSTNKMNASADKLAVDTLKWAAAIGDGETYGQKTKVESLGDGIVIVSTGIVRPGDPAFDQEEFDATISRHRVQAQKTPKGVTPEAEEV